MPDAPQFSVITVVKNGAAQIARCLDSVQAQRAVQVEHIIVDGGSNDGTLELIRQRADKLAWWTSEPDGGIGDAMNKGAARARGQWLLFLHSDDHLADRDILSCAAPYLDPTFDLVAFAVDYARETRLHRLRPRGFGPWLNFKTGFLHQGVLFNRRRLDRLGPYDPNFKIAVDYELFLRAQRLGATAKLCPEVALSVMSAGGISGRRDRVSIAQRLGEERAVHLKHCPSSTWRLIYAVYWALYPLYKRTLMAA